MEKTIGYFGKKAKDGNMALEDMTGGKYVVISLLYVSLHEKMANLCA